MVQFKDRKLANFSRFSISLKLPSLGTQSGEDDSNDFSSESKISKEPKLLVYLMRGSAFKPVETSTSTGRSSPSKDSEFTDRRERLTDDVVGTTIFGGVVFEDAHLGG